MCETGHFMEQRRLAELEDLRDRVKRLELERDRIWNEAQAALNSHRFLEQLANHLFPMVKEDKAKA